MTRQTQHTYRRLLCVSMLGSALVFASRLPGCAADKAPSTRPLTMEERQDAALKDPMGYKPAIGHETSDGDITTFDRDGFKRDVDHALNP